MKTNIIFKLLLFISLYYVSAPLRSQNNDTKTDSVGIAPRSGNYFGDNFWLTKGGGLTGTVSATSLFGEHNNWSIRFAFNKANLLNPDFTMMNRIESQTKESVLYSTNSTSMISSGNFHIYTKREAVNEPNTIPDFAIKGNGFIGIGISSPNEKLELYNGNFRASYPSLGSSTGIFHIKPNSTKDGVWLGTTSSHNITLAANNKGVIALNKDGYAVVFRNGEYPSTLHISTANKAKYSLFVLGGVLSEDYSIGPKATWADHVFDTDYKLIDLKEVESFIATNNRLPDIPSASEVGAEGYSLHDMNVKLLQKVEELTLYSIEQNKEIEQLKEIANSYNSLLEKIEKIESKMKK